MPSSLNRLLPWILGLSLIVFTVGLCFNPAECNDLFWQIRAGRDIAASGHAPHADAYSWTQRGTPWVAHEWLCFWLLWKLFQTGGFAAIWIGEAALVALTFTLVYVHALRETEGSPITAFLLAVAAAIVSCGFFQPRPHLWTYLFLTLTIAALTHLRRSPASWRRAWLLPAALTLWSNLHAGVIVGVGMVFAFALGDALEAWASPPPARADPWLRARRTALLGLACAAATLATPYGWRIYENLGATLGNATAMNIVSEWASPNFHDADGKVLAAFLALLAYGVTFTRRRREWAPLLILVLLVHEALGASRNVPLLAIAGVLLFAGDLHSSLKRHLAGDGGAETSLFGHSPSLVSVAAVAVAIVAASGMRAAAVLQSDGAGAALAPRIATASFKLTAFPNAACRFVETEQFPESVRIYNIYDLGGYLIWRLPQYPVFIDGRADVYFGQTLEDARKIYGLPYNWDALLNGYGADVIVTTAAQNQTRFFLTASDWALVYADRPDLGSPAAAKSSKVNALIFVKRLPKYDALIARCRKDCPAAARMRAESNSRNFASLK